MDLTFETQGTSTYLVYKIEEDDTIDSMNLGMLTNNKIPGLANTLFTQMDKTKYVKFNVSAKISAKQFFDGTVNKKRLIGVFKGVVDAMLSSDEYMIDPSSIVLDMEYIFVDVSTYETIMICLPIEGYKNEIKEVDFFKNIMFNTQFDQGENCDYVAKLMNYLNSSPFFVLEEFKKVLDSINIVEKPENVTTINQVGLNQQKVNTEISTSVNKGSVDLSSFNQSKVNNITTLPTNGDINGIPVSAPIGNEIQDIKQEKKLGLFSGLRKKDTVKENSIQTKKVAIQGTELAYSIPGVETGCFAIPGQAAPAIQPIQQPAVKQLTPAPVSISKMPNPNPKSIATTSQQQPFIPIQAPQGQPANFGETTVLGGGGNIGETTVLSASNNPAQLIAPHLIRKKNNEKISLNKPVFRMGKEKSYVDYFISDNTAISRSHANFIIRDGEYFVVDTNSTNHTFVNGSMIQSNVETKLTQGDIVRLANEDFEFKIY